MKKLSMRPSRVLRKLRAGEPAACYKCNLDSARVVELVAMTGFDCVWTDMEHVANDLGMIERQVMAAKLGDCDLMVRVSRGGYSDYIRPLELDAAGIMVPHVMSLDDAKQVARMTRFHPLGRRPVDGGNADGAYCAIEFKQYLAEANRERFVAIQIEDPEPLAELDAIAAVPGIDMLFFGPGDFSHGIGAPGEWDHPRIIEARRLVAKAAKRHGKFAGTVATPDGASELIAMGYLFLNIAADVIGLRAQCLDALARFSEPVPKPDRTRKDPDVII